MATKNLPARDKRGRFLPRGTVERPDWILLAVPTVEPEIVRPHMELRREVVAPAIERPAVELRREVLRPVTRRPPARRPLRQWVGNAALFAGLAAGWLAWAHHLGIL
jgi:hypothetical protein